MEDEIARFREYRPKLARFAVDAVSYMRSAQEKNMNILVEGANVRALFFIEVPRWSIWWPEQMCPRSAIAQSAYTKALMLDLDVGSYPYVL